MSGSGSGRVTVLGVSRALARALVAAFALASLASPPARAAEEAATPAGKESYERNCASCHGATGKGDGPAAIEVVPMPRDFSVGQFKFDADRDGRTGTDADLFLVIRDGGAAMGGNPLMPPWAQLGDERIRELVDYIRSLEGARAE